MIIAITSDFSNNEMVDRVNEHVLMAPNENRITNQNTYLPTHPLKAPSSPHQPVNKICKTWELNKLQSNTTAPYRTIIACKEPL